MGRVEAIEDHRPAAGTRDGVTMERISRQEPGLRVLRQRLEALAVEELLEALPDLGALGELPEAALLEELLRVVDGLGRGVRQALDDLCLETRRQLVEAG